MSVRRLAEKISAVLVAGFLVLTIGFASTALAQDQSEPVYLSGLKWAYASTGWVSAGGDPMPKLDASFTEGALKLQGRRFQKGLGTYPFSEIEYELGGRYRAFQAVVGIDDDAQSEDASVVFYVFVDDRLAFTSGVMRRRDAARRIEVSVLGADRLRLVVSDAGDGTRWDYADWAGARLVLASTVDRYLGTLARAVEGLTQRIRQPSEIASEDIGLVEDKRQAYTRAAERSLGTAVTSPGPTQGAFDPITRSLLISNGRLLLSLGYGGDEHGHLSLIDLKNRALILLGAEAGIQAKGGRRVLSGSDTEPKGEGGYRFERVNDPALGPGTRLEADMRISDSESDLTLLLTLYDDSPYFTYQILLAGSAPISPETFKFFESSVPGSLVLRPESQYLTDYSQRRTARIRDDGLLRGEAVGAGKPLLIYSDEEEVGLLLAMIDEAEAPGRFVVRLDRGRSLATFGFEHRPAAPLRMADDHVVSKRLYVEVASTSFKPQTFAIFKKVTRELYPPAPIPEWVRQQWLSWYVYYTGVTEEGIREHIDYIAENLADLGPWHVLIDAGWYVADGRPNGDWRLVDAEKFPSGLRSTVDYARSKGIYTVLYISLPYLDNWRQDGNWIGLAGIINNHREWLIPVGSSTGESESSTYVYNFFDPGFRNYLTEVMRDFFLRYEVDGIKLDGLYGAEGSILAQVLRGEFGVDGLPASQAPQVMEMHRLLYETARELKDDVYIESGWLNPIYAHPYAQTFRYGDEFGSWDYRYPWPGLRLHIDYAALQDIMMGQRANMGAIITDPNNDPLGLRWIEASLALGNQMALSFYFPGMDEKALSDYRARLVHYRPFAGKTYYENSFRPSIFATHVGGTTYLGMVNRDSEPKEVVALLSEYGLDGGEIYALYDVSEERFGWVKGALPVSMEPETFRLFLLRKEPGVMWTNSSFEWHETYDGFRLEVSGPNSISGFVQIYIPGLSRVLFDGIPAEHVVGGVDAGYDAEVSILTLRYDHKQPHEIQLIR